MSSSTVYTNKWKALSGETKNAVKTQLFLTLKTEQTRAVRNLISEAIGQIGGTVLNMTEWQNEWGDLINTTWTLFGSEATQTDIDNGLKILAFLLSYSHTTFDENKPALLQLFERTISQKSTNSIQASTINCVSTYLSVLDYKDARFLQVLTPVILQTTFELLVSDVDNGERAMESISDIIEENAKFMRDNFDIFFEFCYKVIGTKEIQDSGIQKMATEALLTYVEMYSSSIKNKPEQIKQLIEMIFYHMVEIDQEISEEWKRPPEGYSEDYEENEDFETIRYGTNAIDRLISSIGEKETLPLISAAVQGFLASPDWRFVFASIMALSQVGEYLQEQDSVIPIVKAILNFIKSDNPMIRYSVYHALGQISDDMRPKFQHQFHSELLPLLVSMLDDPVPRVVSHVGAAITNFIEGMSKEHIKDFVEPLLQRSIGFINQGCSLVQESFLGVISSLVETAGDLFVPYFVEITEIIFQIFQVFPQKEYQQLRGQAIETITIIATVVPSDQFQPYLKPIIQLLIRVQKSDLEEIDPQKCYVLSGWQRMIIDYADEILPYLSEIIPNLFVLAKKVLLKAALPESQTQDDGSGEDTAPQGDDGDDDEEKEVYNSNEEDEAEIAINMIEVFIEQFGQKFLPFVPQTLEILTPLLDYNINDSLRHGAAKCLPLLVNSCMENPSQAQELCLFIIKKLTEASKHEIDPQVILIQIHAIRESLDIVGRFLNEGQIAQLFSLMMQSLVESDRRRNQNEQLTKDEDTAEDEKQYYEQDLETEDDITVAIAEVIGTLFQTHQELSLPVCDKVFTEVLPLALKDGNRPQLYQFGVFLLDDMAEHLGYALVPGRWKAIFEQLAKFSLHEKHFVRHAAVYGLGQFAENTPNEIFPEFSDIIFDTLLKAYNIKKGKEKPRTYQSLRDNVASALFRVIQFQLPCIQFDVFVQNWFDILPLKEDDDEGVLAHEYLAIFVRDYASQIFANSENIVRVVRIFSEIINTPMVNQATNKVIWENLIALYKEPLVQSNWDNITKGLKPQAKTNLQKFMNQPDFE